MAAAWLRMLGDTHLSVRCSRRKADDIEVAMGDCTVERIGRAAFGPVQMEKLERPPNYHLLAAASIAWPRVVQPSLRCGMQKANDLQMAIGPPPCPWRSVEHL